MGILRYTTFILIIASHSTVAGQSKSVADEYLKLAESFRTSQRDSAILYYQKAAAEFEKWGNTESVNETYNLIGILLTRQDKYDMARSYLQKALVNGLSGDTNNLTLSTTYIALGVIHAAEKDYEQSLHYHFKSLSIRLGKLGENHADVATSFGNIGNVYFRKKEYDNAIDAHLKAMKIRQKLFGTSGEEVIQSYENLGNVYREKKDYETSLGYFKQALDNKIIQVGNPHKELVRYYKSLSDVHYLLNNKDQGDHYKSQAEELIKK